MVKNLNREQYRALKLRRQQSAQYEGKDRENDRNPTAVAKGETRFDPVDALAELGFHLINVLVDLIDALVDLSESIFKSNPLIVKPLIHLGAQLLNLVAD